MKSGKLFGMVLAALGALGGSVAAHAQLGVYGIYSGDHFGGIQCYNATTPCSNGTPGSVTTGTSTTYSTGGVDPSGGYGGIYYDFKNLGPFRLGADVRAGVIRANKSAVVAAGGAGITTSDSILGGVRGVVRTPFTWLRPYIQGSAGFSRSDASEPAFSTTPLGPRVYDNFIQYEAFAGADIRIFPVLDVRAIELGIGNMNRVGSGSGTNSIGIRSIGAGVVLRFPVRQ